MDYLGPLGSGTSRVATKGEITGGSGTPYQANTISADLTIPTGNSMVIAEQFSVTGTAALIIQGTSVVKII
jgi:hypothetical protein